MSVRPERRRLDFLKSASSYAAKGWAVFPCHPKAKEPIENGGFKNATLDLVQIKLWSDLYPNANVGIATGLSNLYVIDADTYKDEFDKLAMKELVDSVPEFKQAFVTRTGAGGFQYFFRMPEDVALPGTASALFRGLDTRGTGGYVVAPPSIHPSGNAYKWLRTGPVDSMPVLPQALVTRVQDAKAKPGYQGEAGNPEDMIPPGMRHSFFLTMAARLRNMGMNEEEMLMNMRSTNQRRCDPLHDDADLEYIARDFANKNSKDDLFRYAANQRGFTEAPSMASSVSAGRQTLQLTTYAQIEESTIEWLWDNYLAKGGLVIAGGVGGMGKSYSSLDLCAAFSVGRALPGEPGFPELEGLHYHRAYSSIALTFEDNQSATVKQRLRKCGADLSRVFTVPMDKAQLTYKDYQMLANSLEDNPEVKFVLIDPLNSILAGLNENSETEIRGALEPLNNIAIKYGIVIMGIKHLNKANDGPPQSRLGGSTAFFNVPRAVFLVGEDVEKPRTEDRTSYHGFIPIKSNTGHIPPGVSFEIGDLGLRWHGVDPQMVYSRILPKSAQKEK